MTNATINQHGKPTFAQDDLPAERPTFDPDALTVGSTVWVAEPGHRHRRGGGNPSILAEVTAKARVWVTVTRTGAGWPKEWRFRLDTQADGRQSNWAPHFRTPEQDLFHRAYTEASAYLAEQGIRPDLGSPWRAERATIQLARMIWEAVGEGAAGVAEGNHTDD
jgi:hypothetical protein